MRSARSHLEPGFAPEMDAPEKVQNKTTRRTLERLLALSLFLVFSVSGCIPSQLEKSRSEAFRQYEIIVRWSQWDAAADFISPEFLEEGMSATQVVEIKLFNTNQGLERTIIDEQLWRYDEVSQRWRLHSPLPDPTQGR